MTQDVLTPTGTRTCHQEPGSYSVIDIHSFEITDAAPTSVILDAWLDRPGFVHDIHPGGGGAPRDQAGPTYHGTFPRSDLSTADYVPCSTADAVNMVRRWMVADHESVGAHDEWVISSLLRPVLDSGEISYLDREAPEHSADSHLSVIAGYSEIVVLDPSRRRFHALVIFGD